MALMSDKAVKQRSKAQPETAQAEQLAGPVIVDSLAVTAEQFAAENNPQPEVEVAEATVATAQAVAQAASSAKVRVVKAGFLMLGGCVQRFKPGMILDPNHYGEQFKQILDAIPTERIA